MFRSSEPTPLPIDTSQYLYQTKTALYQRVSIFTYLNFFSSLRIEEVSLFGTLYEFQNLHDLFKDQVINVETLTFSRLDLSLVSEEDFNIFASFGMFRRSDGFYGGKKIV